MRKYIAFLVIILACSVSAFSQNVRWDLGAPGSAGAATVGPGSLIYALGNVQLNFCSYPANAVPCTNYANTYPTLSSSSPCPSTQQVVLQNSNVCQATSDTLGNLGVWALPGTYSYTLTQSGVTYGPFLVMLNASGGSGTVNNCAFANSVAYYAGAGSIVSCDQFFTDDGAGNPTAKSLGLTDSTHSGFWFETAGPLLPGLTASHTFYFSVNPSFGTTYGLEPWDNIPTNGDCVSSVTGDAANWVKLHDSGTPCTSGSTTHGLSFTLYNSAGLASGSTTASTTYLTIPFGCTIQAYNLAIDSGTITVKFWKVATGTAIPTSGNSISTSGVAISSGTAIHSTTLTDFTTTTVSANDIMAMNISAVSGATFVNGVLQCQ